MRSHQPRQRREGVFLSGKFVNLTVLTEDDVRNSDWYDWFNDENTTQFMQQHYFPNTRDTQLAFLKRELSGSLTKLQLGIQIGPKQQIVGVTSLQDIDLINRKAEISIVLGDKTYRKVRYALEAIGLLIKHGFDTLNLNRIYGGTLMREWADLLVRVFGFQMEGLRRQDVFKNGTYNDVFFVGLLREDFRGHKRA